MSRAIAPGGGHEYSQPVRKMLHLLLLLAVATLPMAAFAARAGAPIDLTSNAAVEIEQGTLPAPGRTTAPAQEHRHCTVWAAQPASCRATADHRLGALPPGPIVTAAAGVALAVPEPSTPPPRA